MLQGLTYTAASMQAGARAHDVIVENLANASNSGYKRRIPLDESFAAALEAAGQSSTAGIPPAIDFSQGPLQRTDTPLDLAIRGEGFFVTAAGDETVYTRKGNFTLSPTSQLITSAGYPVLTQNGALSIPPGTRQITIDKEGRVIADSAEVGQLIIVKFENTQGLQPASECSFRATDASGAAEPSGAAEICQGYIEQSNVNVIEEMVRMIDTMRSYEASQRTVSKMEETLKDLNRSVEVA